MRIATDPRWPATELVGFLLHSVSRSETRRRLKQLHANFDQRLWREAKKQAEIHLANVSIWRKQMRIDNKEIVPENGTFLNEIEKKKAAKTVYFSIIYG